MYIRGGHSLRTQTCFRLSLVSAKNNVCEPEPGNDFCDIMIFVSLWPIRFHDRMKLECSSQGIPCAVVLGLLELNCDWVKIPTSQKSFPGSGSQMLFSAETSDSRKYVCVCRLRRLRLAGYQWLDSSSHDSDYSRCCVSVSKSRDDHSVHCWGHTLCSGRHRAPLGKYCSWNLI